jgi:hypothetical protein
MALDATVEPIGVHIFPTASIRLPDGNVVPLTEVIKSEVFVSYKIVRYISDGSVSEEVIDYKVRAQSDGTQLEIDVEPTVDGKTTISFIEDSD